MRSDSSFVGDSVTTVYNDLRRIKRRLEALREREGEEMRERLQPALEHVEEALEPLSVAQKRRQRERQATREQEDEEIRLARERLGEQEFRRRYRL